jgi:hypothetical protein
MITGYLVLNALRSGHQVPWHSQGQTGLGICLPDKEKWNLIRTGYFHRIFNTSTYQLTDTEKLNYWHFV